MSTPTTPRSAQAIALSTMIAFWRASKVRSIIRIRPARTCGYSSRARSRPADRGEDDVVEVALAAAVALHRVEAELERRDALRAVRAADRAVHRALDRERGGLDQLRPVVDRVERVEVLDAARIRHGDERLELPVVLHGQGDPLLVREAPENVRGDRAAEVRVELGEALVRRRSSGHSIRRALAPAPSRKATSPGRRGRGSCCRAASSCSASCSSPRLSPLTFDGRC